MPVFRKIDKRRRGVSLLEVLVSIGVTSVGLLGVLALIPLGGAQARQGEVMERCPVIGQGAMAEIRNRDMLAPGNWLTSAGVNPTSSYQVAFCLDPLSVSSGVTTNFPPQATGYMSRLTLIGNPNEAAAADKIMSKAMAESIFRSHDDMAVTLSTADRTLPPTQVWTKSTTSTEPTRRQSRGSMSWMATVFPNRALGSPSDIFTVSIVVFHNRVIDTSLKTEFTANITSMPGAGVSGGDIVADFTGMGYNAEELGEAKTPENSWVLLSAVTTDPVFTGAYDVDGNPINQKLHVFEWYRVIASDNTSAELRQITLAGPDWPTSGLESQQVTIIPGAVAVYQENMQLDGASLWRN